MIKVNLDEAKRRLMTIHGNNISMYNYYSINSFADFECNSCGNKWTVKAYNVLNTGHGCSLCSHLERAEKRILPKSVVLGKMKEKHGNTIKLLEYTSAMKKSKFKCVVCEHIWFAVTASVYNNGNGCPNCGMINSIKNRSASKSHFWKGGVTKLRFFIRESAGLKKWQEESMNLSSYKCVVTGERFDVIHHLYPLNKIIKDALCELGLEKYEFIGDYSEDDLRPIIDKVIEIHYRHPMGVCLREDVHNLFHKIYTRENCTPEDFYEFVERINLGEIVISQ